MSRYIDAEWLRNVYADFEHYENRDDWTTPISNVLAVIDDAPSLEIIRCGECKHWERLNYEAPKEGWCDDQMPYSDGRWVDADDYCSYGEREGE